MTSVLTSVFGFDQPVETVFTYLVDPRNRAQWQSSLKRIEQLSDVAPQVGQTWTDVTAVGVRAAMETTVLEPYRVWTERGTWRGISAELTLRFVAVRLGCTVQPELRVTGSGLLRPLGPLLTAVGRFAVPGDLRRAAGLLSTG